MLYKGNVIQNCSKCSTGQTTGPGQPSRPKILIVYHSGAEGLTPLGHRSYRGLPDAYTSWVPVLTLVGTLRSATPVEFWSYTAERRSYTCADSDAYRGYPALPLRYPVLRRLGTNTAGAPVFFDYQCTPRQGYKKTETESHNSG
ncbi:hypothetical protein AVEN_131012-1 [Araneus ventricosus]|uniref:Uncharacterized protein n=1 Tax=Araneus ventricosus TaxID=182803 RepID=A0A4Y2TVQ6_ARAVE|nr:hypothetical protein AVEN_131012-1 [Araneus ventricosus]